MRPTTRPVQSIKSSAGAAIQRHIWDGTSATFGIGQCGHTAHKHNI